jgi:hypothetical protein
MQVHADDIMATIREHGWWQERDGDQTPNGRLCMAMAAARLWNTRGIAALNQVVHQMYPERTTLGVRPVCVAFNDHPDTTLEDVERVVKEAESLLS